MKKFKVDFFKCETCDFQTTIKKDGEQHGKPFLQMIDGQLQMNKAHKIKNLKGELIVNT